MRPPILLRFVAEFVMLVEAMVDAVVHLCKAGVRGSIPLVSTLVSTEVRFADSLVVGRTRRSFALVTFASV